MILCPKYSSTCQFAIIPIQQQFITHPRIIYKMRNYDFLFSFILDAMLCDVRCRFNLTHKVF